MPETTVRFNLQAFGHARVDKRMKIRELAEKLGRHPGSISNWLVTARRGEPLTVSQISAMAWALDVPVEELVVSEQPSA